MQFNSTEYHKMEDKMRKYLMHFEGLPYGVAIGKNDPSFTIVAANPGFYKVIGQTEEAFWKNHKNSLSNILLDGVWDTIENEIVSDEDWDGEWDLPIQRADGSALWVHDIVHYDVSEDLFFMTLFDITDQMVAPVEESSYQILKAKEEASKMEAVSEATLWECLRENYQHLEHEKESIADTLDVLCHHYDGDFAVILMTRADGSCGISYMGGDYIPDLSDFQESSRIMNEWITTFEQHLDFTLDVDFVDLTAPDVKRTLEEKYGIYNFVVSPVRNAQGIITGLLFINNVKLLTRSRLMVHVVAKATSDYLAKTSMNRKIQLEPTTKLANKVTTEQSISTMLQAGEVGTLFIVDIDNFKGLNDTWGHRFGDQVILDVADTLRHLFRTTDVIGRVGGDEFMVFAPGLILDESISEKASQLQTQCHRQYEKDGVTVEVSTSVGICCAGEQDKAFYPLYEKADYALYISKKRGKNQYCVYNGHHVTCGCGEVETRDKKEF